jgi:hypothetical protein
MTPKLNQFGETARKQAGESSRQALDKTEESVGPSSGFVKA